MVEAVDAGTYSRPVMFKNACFYILKFKQKGDNKKIVRVSSGDLWRREE